MKKSYLSSILLLIIITLDILLSSQNIILRGELFNTDIRLIQMVFLFIIAMINLIFAIVLAAKKDKVSGIHYLYIGGLLLLTIILGGLSMLTYILTSTGPWIGI